MYLCMQIVGDMICGITQEKAHKNKLIKAHQKVMGELWL